MKKKIEGTLVTYSKTEEELELPFYTKKEHPWSIINDHETNLSITKVDEDLRAMTITRRTLNGTLPESTRRWYSIEVVERYSFTFYASDSGGFGQTMRQMKLGEGEFAATAEEFKSLLEEAMKVLAEV